MKWLRTLCLIAGLTMALFAMPSFAQPSPVLQISKGGSIGIVELSWSEATGFLMVQTATSLSRPITWQSTITPLFLGGPQTNVMVIESPRSPRFFRLAQALPVFQFAAFYNLDLDMTPGQSMVFNGPIYANGNIWLWPYASVTFNGTVSSAVFVTNHMQPYDQQSSNGYVAPTYNDGPPISHATPLVLVGSSMQTLLNLPPPGLGAPNPAAYSVGQSYLFNECDLIISNAANGLPGTHGTNITVYFQDPASFSPLTQIPPDATNGFGTGVTNQFFSFATNVQFYDFREKKTNQAVQINIAKLSIWLTNRSSVGGWQWNQQSALDKGHGIESVYIYNNVPATTGQLPSVRLVNGAQLPSTIYGSGLTVATPQPVYVLGNYNVQTATSAAGASAGTTNTAYTYPASIMADAITVLSLNWNDTGSAYVKGGSLSSRTPVNTTINAACLEGIVVSTNSGGNNYYSGGIENFLRLEENWSSSTILTYNGSIVVMFPSQYATNVWQVPGNYYNPPPRHWGVDLNFTDLSKLPPLTPVVANFVTP